MVRLKRIDVLAYAQLQGLTAAVFGFLLALLQPILALLTNGLTGDGTAFFVGLCGLVIYPACLGIAGLIFGTITALIYNVGLKSIGGIVLEVEVLDDEPTNAYAGTKGDS